MALSQFELRTRKKRPTSTPKEVIQSTSTNLSNQTEVKSESSPIQEISYKGLDPRQLAELWLSRKLRGQKIITVPQRPTLKEDEIYREARKIYSKLVNNPKIRRELDIVSEAKSKAFGDSSVIIKKSKFIDVSGTVKRPTKQKQEKTTAKEIIIPAPISVRPDQVVPNLKSPQRKKDVSIVTMGVGGNFIKKFTGLFLRKKFVPIKEERKINQVFIKELGGKAQETSLGQGTSIVTPFTQSEQKKIEEAQFRGSPTGLLKTYQEKVVLPLSKTKFIQEKVRPGVKLYEEKVVKGIAQPGLKVSGKIIESAGEKTPILKDIVKARKIIERLPPSQEVPIGIGSNLRRVKAGTLQGKSLAEFSQAIIGGEVEESFTSIPRSLGASKEVSRVIGKSVRLGSEIATLSLPGVFATGFTSGAIESATGGTLGGEKNLIKFIGKRPIQTTFFTSGALLKAGKLISNSGQIPKVSESKYSKFLNEPEKFKARLKSVQKKQKIELDLLAQKNIARIKKGKVSIQKPRGISSGRLVVEAETPRKFRGTIEFFKKRRFFKDKVIKGTTSFNPSTERTINVLDIGRNLKKVTIIEKSGKTTVKILKKGKIVAEETFKGGKHILPEERLLAKLSSETIKKKGKAQSKLFKNLKKDKEISIKQKPLKKTQIKSSSAENIIKGSDKDIAKGFKGIKSKSITINQIDDIAKSTPEERIINIKGVGSIKKSTTKGLEFVKDKISSQERGIGIGIIESGKKKGAFILKKPKIFRKVKFKTSKEIIIGNTDDFITESLKKSSKSSKGISNIIKSTKDNSKKVFSGRIPKSLSKKQISKFLKGTKEKVKIPKLSIQELKSKLSGLESSKFKLGIAPIIKTTSKSPFSFFGVSGAVASALSTGKKVTTEQKPRFVQEKIQISDTDKTQDEDTTQDFGNKPDTDTISGTSPKIKTKPAITLKKPSLTQTKTPSPQVPSLPTIPPTIKPKPIIDESLLTKQKLKVKKHKISLAPKQEFYIPEARRNDKWVPLSDIGMPKISALGRGARAVDLTVSAQFRIKPVKKGDPKIIDTYFSANKNKFRGYRIVKGKKVPLKNRFIEKRGEFRIDTPTEKAGLTLSKLIKKQGWRKRKTKQKKKIKLKDLI